MRIFPSLLGKTIRRPVPLQVWRHVFLRPRDRILNMLPSQGGIVISVPLPFFFTFEFVPIHCCFRFAMARVRISTRLAFRSFSGRAC